uniref:autotransporter outer membrane beta-barrel domain-containing protein n=1 Tax=uncultured Fusobacterium sp. TaxID=159267 RepID=UPI0027DB635D
MMEQLMKTVKRGNKKRSINITIGAVVGFLLSCTAVMGAEDNYLWIKEDGGAIKFSADTTDGTDGNWNEKNLYEKNIWDIVRKTYMNNMELSSSEGIGYGLSGDLSKFTFINNGSIEGIGENYGYGIYNIDTIKTLINNGLISGTGGNKFGVGIYNTGTVEALINNGSIMGNAKDYGIYNAGTITTLINNGLIIGQNNGIYNEVAITTLTNNGLMSRIYNAGTITILINNGIIERVYNIDTINSLTNNSLIVGTSYGIWNNNGISNPDIVIEEIKNEGIIIGKSEDGQGAGINNYSGKINKLENIGKIAGISSASSFAQGYGITSTGSTSEIGIDNLGMISGIGKTIGRGLYLESTTKNIINNFGIVFGTSNAVYKSFSAKIEGNNYGLLLNQNDTTSPVDRVTINNAGAGDPEIKNYGIVFKVKSDGKYDVSYRYIGSEDVDVKMFSKEREMKVKNAVTSAASSNSFSENSYKNSIINGITDTILISGIGKTIEGSVVNAYTSAIKFDNSSDNSLTISGSVINGGLDNSGIAIKGDSQNDELILESGEIKFKDGSIEKINTVINGDIDLGDGDNKLAISDGTIINGEILSGTGTSSLVLGKQNVTKKTVKDEIIVSNNIKGFDKTSIYGNITISDKTYVVKNDLSTAEEKLTVELGDITLESGSTITLKINASDTDISTGKIIGHALYNNTGNVVSNGGKLLLDIGTLSDESIINFGKTELENSIKGDEADSLSDITLSSLSLFHNIEKLSTEEVLVKIKKDLPVASYPDDINYYQLNKVYKGILSTDQIKYFNVTSQENLSAFLGYLNDIYAGNPYSYSSELSRKSMGMFRDIAVENQFKADTGKWMIY